MQNSLSDSKYSSSISCFLTCKGSENCRNLIKANIEAFGKIVMIFIGIVLEREVVPYFMKHGLTVTK